MDAEPRTVRDIIADLLRLALEGEWSGRVNTGCHCHPEYTPCCPECGAREHPEGEHKADCARMTLISEARAFLRVENELSDARGEEGVYVP